MNSELIDSVNFFIIIMLYTFHTSDIYIYVFIYTCIGFIRNDMCSWKILMRVSEMM